MRGFDKDIVRGHEAEDRVASIFYAAGCSVQRKNVDGRADLILGVKGWPHHVEVKNEDNYWESGNICIEIYQGRGERWPSGISISESTVCIHTLKDNATIYATQAMRLFLKTCGVPTEDFRNSDNGNGGFKLPIHLMANFPWFEFCDFTRLPYSKIFKE